MFALTFAICVSNSNSASTSTFNVSSGIFVPNSLKDTKKVGKFTKKLVIKESLLPSTLQWVRKLKKSPGKKTCEIQYIKKIFREIPFLAVLNFFPVQKLIFGHF